MTRSYESLEIIRKKSSMSQQIVSRKDEEYARYAGASLADAETMAMIDTLEKYGLSHPIVTLFRSFLNQRRKAFLASASSEVTKLGFILGLKDARATGKGTRSQLNKARKTTSNATD